MEMPLLVGLPWKGNRWGVVVFPQGPINAQMLAQRQREILSQHLRQRQMQQQQQQVQQRTLMMRGQSLSMTPSMVATGGIPATMSNPRMPQANAQQFPFPPNYGTGSTPTPCVLSGLTLPCSFPSVLGPSPWSTGSCLALWEQW